MTNKNKVRIIVELDAAELAVRLIETVHGRWRPEKRTAREFLDDIKGSKTDPDRFVELAYVALKYFDECSKAAQMTQ